MLKQKKLQRSEYDEESGSYTAFFLDEKVDLAEFIVVVNPKDINLNKVPIKQWFMYYYDDHGDSYYELIYLLKDYIEDRIAAVLSIASSVVVAKEILDE